MRYVSTCTHPCLDLSDEIVHEYILSRMYTRHMGTSKLVELSVSVCTGNVWSVSVSICA